MHMPHLAQLHHAMQAVPIERMRFALQHNHLRFDGVFLADTTPYQLGLACVAHNFVLLFDVDAQYHLAAYIHDAQALAALKAALHRGAGSGHKFSASQFLQQIDAALPQQAHAQDAATPADVVRVYANIEDANKLRFLKWVPHTATSGRTVTEKNLEKTRLLLGQATHDWCHQNNISSAWMV